jgi:hypothetical protein
MHPTIEKIANQAVDHLKQAFGQELESVILYGSAMTADYNPRKSDINLLVVLTPKGIAEIKKTHLFAGWWRKHRVRMLFMTRDYIGQSLDCYPVEFLDMQGLHRVLEGEDALSGLQIPKSELRLQCEREIKGKLLHLRMGYVGTGGKPKAVRHLIGESLPVIASLFRALLFLAGRPVPDRREDVFNEACGEFHLDLALFQNLQSIRDKGITYNKFELDNFMERYISEIERLCHHVDAMIP